METSIYMDKFLYKHINKIALDNKNEQMMLYGGKTIGNSVVVNYKSFVHLQSDNLISSDSESIKVSLKELEKYIIANKQLGNDTFFMTHSHPCKSNMFEFMFGDLSNDDEVISQKIRKVCNKYGLDYIDGITTGRKLYYWSTHDMEKYPKLLKCYIDGIEINYNNLTQITEDLEHILIK